MTKCVRCIFPETIPGISFDPDGVCSYCRDYTLIRYKGEAELEEHFSWAQRMNREYDCIVPLSGGRDSSFVLLFAKTRGLKPLAVNYDNAFREDQALANMQRACQALGVPFVSFKTTGSIVRRAVREGIRANLACGVKGVATSFCDPCSYGIRATAYMLAERHKVPLIIWGNSAIEKTTHMTVPHLKTASPRTSTIGSGFLRYRYFALLQRLEFASRRRTLSGTRSSSLRPRHRDIREISLFDYVPWERKKIKEAISSQLGWEVPKPAASTWRTDCRLKPLVNYCFHALFGCSKGAFGYHNMICEGEMLREEALRQEESTPVCFTSGLENLLGKDIGLSSREIQVIRSFERQE